MTECYKKECIYHEKDKPFGFCRNGTIPCPTLPIELDEWESQFVYLSKNYFSYSIGYIMSNEELLEVAKKIWAKRCGLEIEHVKVRNIVRNLIFLCQKLGCFEKENTLLTFIGDIAPFNKYFPKQNDSVQLTPEDFNFHVFKACMNYLSFVKVKEKDHNYDRWYDLIKMADEMDEFIMEHPEDIYE